MNEIARTRVRFFGGNCLIGYKVTIDRFEYVATTVEGQEEHEVCLFMSAIGDAVLLDETASATPLR